VRFLKQPRLYVVTGFVAVLAFAGDIVADSLADARGDHCIAQSSQSDSQHEKTPCSHCSCAVHNGFMVASTIAINVASPSPAALFVVSIDQRTPIAVPASIDHPPRSPNS
jgi:hypothetical protein